ncbi:EF0163 family protein [Lactococcus garvieae]|uniref:EF0163 family protein n=1 Tax=Lactococcus garvieae TaxID=1363 RepID=UPI00385372A5
MKKRILILILVVLAVVFLVPKNKQESKENSLPEGKQDVTVQSSLTNLTSSSSEIALENTSDPKDVINNFIESYYNYSSESERNQATKEFCNETVQKKLHLVEPEKDIKMSSHVTSSEIYSGGQYDYLVLVSYTLNDNQVVPQVLKISVETIGDGYKISDVQFPLMN